jgi:chlorobactene glucosyltransferase
MRARRWGAIALWGWTAGILTSFAVLARRTSEVGAPVCPPDAAPGEGSDPAQLAEPDSALPLVSIVVPARNEERNIQACVESLLEQDYPHFEVIVVDDASDDATPRLLELMRRQHPEGERLRVVRVEELPPGWAGKPHALHTGALHAHGAWLLFTDADTRHSLSALSAALRCARARGADLFSLMTSQELPGFWNRVLMPIAYIGISAMYPSRQVNDPHSDVAIANGQFLLIRRAVYDAVGGYDTPAMRATIVDDRDLAREVKRAGYRLEVADGRTLVRTRMYSGLREHWHGWGKNAYVGSRGGPALFAAMTLGLLLSSVGPFALLAAGLARRRRAWSVAGALQVAALVALRTRIDRSLGVPWSYMWTHPLGGAIFSAILARAGLRKLTGRGVEWSGRIYR